MLTILGAAWLAPLASCDRGRTGPAAPPAAPARRAGVVALESTAGMVRWTWQTVYVPAYSHVETADGARPFHLAVTLSVRNTDETRPIIVTSVRYHDRDGRLVRQYAPRPLKLAPLAAADFFVKESDTAAGGPASFLVDWFAEKAALSVPGLPDVAPHASVPVVEAVMVGTAGTQGVSFVCTGRALAGQYDAP